MPNLPLHPPQEAQGFLRGRDEKLPGHALALSMGKVWEVVREHKDLNLPAHRVSEGTGRPAGLWEEGDGAGRRLLVWEAAREHKDQSRHAGAGGRPGGQHPICPKPRILMLWPPAHSPGQGAAEKHH